MTKNRSTFFGHSGISQIIGALLMLAIVSVVGSGILLQGMVSINDFNNIIFKLDERNDSFKEDLIVEHVFFEPTSTDIQLSLRNTGIIEISIDVITIVNLDTQQIIVQNEVNKEIPVSEMRTIQLNTNLNDSWENSEFNTDSYMISVSTVRGNSFDITSKPFFS